MKYNYNFIEEIKQKNPITEKKEKEAVDLQKMTNPNNYENNYNVSDIKPIWLRSKFKGDDSELENCTNLIKQQYKDGRIYKDEDKCLEKIIEYSNIYN